MPEMNGKVLNWASDLDPNALTQAQRATKMPFVPDHVALMPDAHVAQARGLEAVLTELVDDIAAQHDADELELPPSAELLYTTPAAASDAAELDRLRRLPGEMTLKSFTAYEYNEAVQALLYPGSDPITGGTRELLVPTVQRVADARNLDLEGRD